MHSRFPVDELLYQGPYMPTPAPERRLYVQAPEEPAPSSEPEHGRALQPAPGERPRALVRKEAEPREETKAEKGLAPLLESARFGLRKMFSGLTEKWDIGDILLILILFLLVMDSDDDEIIILVALVLFLGL